MFGWWSCLAPGPWRWLRGRKRWRVAALASPFERSNGAAVRCGSVRRWWSVLDSGWEAARRRSAALPATSLECEPPTAGGGCDCESWERGVCEQGGVYISSTSPAASHYGGDLWRPAHWGRLVWWIQCEGHRRLGAELRGRRWKCVHRWLGRAATARAFVGTTTHGHGMPFACRLRSFSGCWW